ncbi:MAG TPA: CBS domain-containing protein [Natrialbaceae archaeon]|nr:CBS domain-containing protein [Natrialbaceae archaeon]
MPVKTLAVDVVTATKDTLLPNLATMMHEEDVGDVVIADGRKPIGIVTDRDVALAVAQYDNLADVTAENVMSTDPVTIHEDATAVDLPARMAEAGVRRIPVVDDDGDLTGIATLDDVVATAGEMLKDVATVIESQSREYRPEP